MAVGVNSRFSTVIQQEMLAFVLDCFHTQDNEEIFACGLMLLASLCSVENSDFDPEFLKFPVSHARTTDNGRFLNSTALKFLYNFAVVTLSSYSEFLKLWIEPVLHFVEFADDLGRRIPAILAASLIIKYCKDENNGNRFFDICLSQFDMDKESVRSDYLDAFHSVISLIDESRRIAYFESLCQRIELVEGDPTCISAIRKIIHVSPLRRFVHPCSRLLLSFFNNQSIDVKISSAVSELIGEFWGLDSDILNHEIFQYCVNSVHSDGPLVRADAITAIAEKFRFRHSKHEVEICIRLIDELTTKIEGYSEWEALIYLMTVVGRKDPGTFGNKYGDVVLPLLQRSSDYLSECPCLVTRLLIFMFDLDICTHDWIVELAGKMLIDLTGSAFRELLLTVLDFLKRKDFCVNDAWTGTLGAFEHMMLWKKSDLARKRISMELVCETRDLLIDLTNNSEKLAKAMS
jgi:hypothetical protein